MIYVEILFGVLRVSSLAVRDQPGNHVAVQSQSALHLLAETSQRFLQPFSRRFHLSLSLLWFVLSFFLSPLVLLFALLWASGNEGTRCNTLLRASTKSHAPPFPFSPRHIRSRSMLTCRQWDPLHRGNETIPNSSSPAENPRNVRIQSSPKLKPFEPNFFPFQLYPSSNYKK